MYVTKVMLCGIFTMENVVVNADKTATEVCICSY